MTEQAVTLRDVAARAGVHPATASRALNPETRLLVKEDTARRVLEAAELLGYHPNPVARSLRTRRSHTVGVIIPDLTNPLFPPIVRGLEDRLAAAGFVALIGNTVNYTDPTSGASDTGTVQAVDINSSGPTLTINGTSGIAPSSVTEVS